MATVYVYVMETLADWEIGNVMAELHSKRFFRKDAPEIEVKTVGNTEEAIHSMGGLTILPDCTTDKVIIDKSNMLILPGSDTWSDSGHETILEKAEAFLEAGATVAAICGATVALAGKGVLNERPHTSNGYADDTARVTDLYSKRGKSQAMTGKQRGGVRDDEKMV